MDQKSILVNFINNPSASSLSDLADDLEGWTPATKLQKIASRALFLEDERLQGLLKEAVKEAKELLKNI